MGNTCGGKNNVQEDKDERKINQHKPKRIKADPNVLHGRYVYKKRLGKGHFATVERHLDLETNTEVAIKVIKRKHLGGDKEEKAVKRETDILKEIDNHPNVVRLIDSFKDDEHFFLVMELCTGGDLFNRISQYGVYTEKDASKCARQLASALLYIHSKGVTHRDLKPENILLSGESDPPRQSFIGKSNFYGLTIEDLKQPELKIADFGLSHLSPDHQKMQTVCGTWAYAAPEVVIQKKDRSVKERYTDTVDNWSLGVILYILLCGYHPFDPYGNCSERELMENILAHNYNFDDPLWEKCSNEPKELIRGLLQMKPSDRLPLGDFLKSTWVSGSETPHRDLKHVIPGLQKQIVSRKKFKAAVFAVIAQQNLKKGQKIKDEEEKVKSEDEVVRV